MNRLPQQITAGLVVLLLMGNVDKCKGQSVSASASSSASSSRTRPFRTIDELLLFFPTKFPDGDWQPVDLQYEGDPSYCVLPRSVLGDGEPHDHEMGSCRAGQKTNGMNL